MFAAEFEPCPDKTGSSSRRRAPRAAVGVDASLAAEHPGRALCRVVDLSTHGARLDTYTPLVRGTTIRLTLPGTDPIAADVTWAEEYSAGCRFHDPLDAATYAAVLTHDR